MDDYDKLAAAAQATIILQTRRLLRLSPEGSLWLQFSVFGEASFIAFLPTWKECPVLRYAEIPGDVWKECGSHRRTDEDGFRNSAEAYAVYYGISTELVACENASPSHQRATAVHIIHQACIPHIAGRHIMTEEMYEFKTMREQHILEWWEDKAPGGSWVKELPNHDDQRDIRTEQGE